MCTLLESENMARSWRSRWAKLALVCVLTALTQPCWSAGLVSEQVIISGALKAALSLKVEDLKAFPVGQIETMTVTRRVGDQQVTSSVRGVRLTAVLERAGLASKDEHEWKHTVVLATATDGYQVVFSWPELFNTDVGAGALLIFERDGQPLADREGQIALVSARDTRSGPRSVRSVARLDVRVLK